VLHAVHSVGAKPHFLDCDLDGNIFDLPKGISILAHMFGKPAPVWGPKVIEDFAMALGARKPRGIAIGSFYATKMITTGHGGFVSGCDVDDLVAYDNQDEYKVRYNYRMSGIAAAMGEVQLRKLPQFIQRRRDIADRYFQELKDSRVELPSRANDHVYYRYVVRARDAESLIRFLKARGIEAKRPVYRPLHTYFSKLRGKYRGAEELHRRAVSLPIYPTLTGKEVDRVVEAVGSFPG
jgi:perosamine synthetase